MGQDFSTRVSLVLLGLLMAGCALGTTYLRPGNPEQGPPLVPTAPETRAVARWTRMGPLGFAGKVQAVLEDPTVIREQIDRQALQEGLTGEAFAALARQEWTRAFGYQRLPFEVTWSFLKNLDPSSRMNPTDWQFYLTTDAGQRVSPVAIGEPRNHSSQDAWIASFRLWFPAQILEPVPRTLTLHLQSRQVQGALTWQFAPRTERGD